MTLWELHACAEGVRIANGGEVAIEPPTPDEFEAMKRKAGY